MRVPKQLEPLYEVGLIDEVLRPLMSGKEAAAWIVRSQGEVVCAKVYKEAHSRSFTQRVAYTEGRKVRNSRDARAMAKRSSFGRDQEEMAWQTAEVDALNKLAAAGVRVPQPLVFSDGVLLMELILDHNGAPAPRLYDVPLSPEHARAMLHFLAEQAARMLLAGIVHGDLSEYNVLIAWDGPVIIDLPQAIDASSNRNAKPVFLRDLDHLTTHLARFNPALTETEYGREIWHLFENGKLRPDSELTGQGPRRSQRVVDGQRLAREVTEAALAEKPRDAEGPRRKRGSGGKPAEEKVYQGRPVGQGPGGGRGGPPAGGRGPQGGGGRGPQGGGGRGPQGGGGGRGPQGGGGRGPQGGGGGRGPQGGGGGGRGPQGGGGGGRGPQGGGGGGRGPR